MLSRAQACQRLACLIAALLFVVPPALAQSADGPLKTIRGIVRDSRGEPIVGANVFLRNQDSNTTRTLSADRDGMYSFNGLPAEADYEVYAEFENVRSESRVVSSLLNRADNVMNLEVGVVFVPEFPILADEEDTVRFETFDLVEIRGSFELPPGIPAPIPAALLLHGLGETRAVWAELKERLLVEGWAVLAIDLRGHGQSRIKNRETFSADELWRTDARQFPLDLEPALNWMQSQPRLDSRRFAVIGSDVGANLALLASGRFPEIGTVVAIGPNLDEALALTGTAREFTPRTTHLIVSEREIGEDIREYVNGASRITVASGTGTTATQLRDSNMIEEIIRWLRDTY